MPKRVLICILLLLVLCLFGCNRSDFFYPMCDFSFETELKSAEFYLLDERTSFLRVENVAIIPAIGNGYGGSIFATAFSETEANIQIHAVSLQKEDGTVLFEDSQLEDCNIQCTYKPEKGAYHGHTDIVFSLPVECLADLEGEDDPLVLRIEVEVNGTFAVIEHACTVRRSWLLKGAYYI